MKIVAFAGGVGGAKLADGLNQCLAPSELTVVVNTGDDFEHWDLNISPDLDTVCYTLAGLANPNTGWGRDGESWQVLANIRELGGPDWFQIGDKDLATHIERTRRRKSGEPLSSITSDFCHAWGIRSMILPMTDQAVATIVITSEAGELAFQEYFVHQHCQPQVKGFRFEGVENARPAPGVLDSINQADGIIFCPSNPWVSLDPILSIYPIRDVLVHKKILAVSPIIGGQTIKGPAAKMFSELGIEASSLAVATHYQDLLTHFVLDNQDMDLDVNIQKLGVKTLITNTIMKTKTERIKLAQDVLNFLERD